MGRSEIILDVCLIELEGQVGVVVLVGAALMGDSSLSGSGVLTGFFSRVSFQGFLHGKPHQEMESAPLSWEKAHLFAVQEKDNVSLMGKL